MSLEQAGNINQAAPNLLKTTETCLLPAQSPYAPHLDSIGDGGPRAASIFVRQAKKIKQIFLGSTNLGKLTYFV